MMRVRNIIGVLAGVMLACVANAQTMPATRAATTATTRRA